MGFNIVLIEPEIPMNTGNIGRLSLGGVRIKITLGKTIWFRIG
jgi:tRNA(Leu) C34 or U34 (ribose-2'-O)-methylase TrmL